MIMAHREVRCMRSLRWGIAILGDKWETDKLPYFEWRRGSVVGGSGNVGSVKESLDATQA